MDIYNMSKKHKQNKKTVLPLVSVCTPTFNRRPFIPFMIKCFEHQTYPKDKIEWIIVDDGTDPIGDLVSDIPQVKYFYSEEKMLLGKKRNYMHTKCSGDIIIYMDDDDYYPPERISHAVEVLMNNPKFLIAGSSEMHIFYESRNSVFQCGPYAPYHATAATFAFRKELLKQTKYDEEKAFAEESKFTKSYTIPLIQLNTLKTILVCSHAHNSLNKEKLLENPAQTKITPSPYKVDDFIKDPVLKQFYTHDMNSVIEHYVPGRREFKPKLMEQLQKTEEERAKRGTTFNIFQHPEIVKMRDDYENKLADKNKIISELLKRVKELTNKESKI